MQVIRVVGGGLGSAVVSSGDQSAPCSYGGPQRGENPGFALAFGETGSEHLNVQRSSLGIALGHRSVAMPGRLGPAVSIPDTVVGLPWVGHLPSPRRQIPGSGTVRHTLWVPSGCSE